MECDDRVEAYRLFIIREPGHSVRTEDEALLKALGHQVRVAKASLATVADQIRRESPDIVLVLASETGVQDPEMDAVLRSIHGARSAPLLVWLDGIPISTGLARTLAAAGVWAMLPGPQTEATINAALTLAIARWQELLAVESTLAEVRSTVDHTVTVHRAVGALMARFHISEACAYRHIQRVSVDSRLPSVEVAEAIIAAVQRVLPPRRPKQIRFYTIPQPRDWDV